MKWLKLDDNTLVNIWQITSVRKLLGYSGDLRSNNYWDGNSWQEGAGFKIVYSDGSSNQFIFNTPEMRDEAFELICSKVSHGDKVIFNNNKPI